MRFGDPQTDEIYDRLIEPVFRNLKIIPVRIDRINHNENIDAKIIQELKVCDFALADLTFARPSVYFEAGFAQGRAVPVIYTCREDHLGPAKPNDTYGNFRVHFDLLMRNIIPWKNSRDSGFKKKLKARIAKVIGPLVLEQKATAAKRKVSDAFSRLSMAERVSRLYRAADDRLRSMQFRKNEHDRLYLSAAKSNANRRAILFDLIPFPGKRALHEEHTRVRLELLVLDPPFQSTDGGAKPIRFLPHWIVCTLKTLPPHRVHDALPYLSQSDSLPGVFKYRDKREVGDRELLTVHIIDNVKSEEDFIHKLNLVLREIRKH